MSAIMTTDVADDCIGGSFRASSPAAVRRVCPIFAAPTSRSIGTRAESLRGKHCQPIRTRTEECRQGSQSGELAFPGDGTGLRAGMDAQFGENALDVGGDSAAGDKECLRDLGILYGQGYHLGRRGPLPIRDVMQRAT